MNAKNHKTFKNSLAYILASMAFASITGWLVSARAVTFQPPPDEGKPLQTTGGASRNPGQCPMDAKTSSKTLKALVPSNNSGLTVAERPTIYVYVPPTTAPEVYFSLEDHNRNPYFQTNVAIDGGEGIVAIQLPEDAPPLEMGKDYQWHFVIKCEGRLGPRNPIASGWIRRVPRRNITAEGTPEEIANAYGRAGIWYDSLATLMKAREAQPGDISIADELQELLTSVGLQEVASVPMVAYFRP